MSCHYPNLHSIQNSKEWTQLTRNHNKLAKQQPCSLVSNDSWKKFSTRRGVIQPTLLIMATRVSAISLCRTFQQPLCLLRRSRPYYYNNTPKPYLFFSSFFLTLSLHSPQVINLALNLSQLSLRLRYSVDVDDRRRQSALEGLRLPALRCRRCRSRPSCDSHIAKTTRKSRLSTHHSKRNFGKIYLITLD